MKLKTIALLVLVALNFNCKSVNKVTYLEPEYNPETIKVKIPETSLADYLRKLPGVTVRGSGENVSVLVRTGNSFLNNSEPLFLVDGNPFNGDYSLLASSINLSDISYISVYKDPVDTGIYGVRGLNGVIDITMK